MHQAELPLNFPELLVDQPLLPARMVNEYVYCARLAYLEWVQGEWAHNRDTVEGAHAHRRVDKPGGKLPAPAAEGADGAPPIPEKIHARSIELSSSRLGLIAKLDLVEGDGDQVIPVDYKKSKRPHLAKGAYDPERVQLCVQGMLLEEAGYRCDHGILYFVASRERVRIEFDEELRELTRSSLHGLRALAHGGRIPQPLVDSPKCPRCSLVGICLPDEVNYLRRATEGMRPLAVGQDESLPLIVQAHSAKVAKKGETLEVSIEDKPVATARIGEVSQLVLMGNVYVTTPTLQALMEAEIPISWHSFGGWLYGHSTGVGHKNIELRTAQYRASFDERACLKLARGWVAAKIHNGRTLLRRNWKTTETASDALIAEMKHDRQHAYAADALPALLGIEGAAAARYFGAFRHMLRKAARDDVQLQFDFVARNRRPPTDPVNALLSFAYAMLTRQFTVTLSAIGLDPFRGFYHQPRYGRPALALDMMEPFRPILADSTVIQVINNGEVRPVDFVRVGSACNLTPEGRKRFLAGFERRLSAEIQHPLFNYKLSYRRLLELQCRLLGRHLLGELDDYPNFMIR